MQSWSGAPPLSYTLDKFWARPNMIWLRVSKGGGTFGGKKAAELMSSLKSNTCDKVPTTTVLRALFFQNLWQSWALPFAQRTETLDNVHECLWKQPCIGSMTPSCHRFIITTDHCCRQRYILPSSFTVSYTITISVLSIPTYNLNPVELNLKTQNLICCNI